MPEHTTLPYLREILLFLALAGVLIPLLERLRINSVLGFLVVGTAIGPYGLGRFSQDLPWLGWLTIGSVEQVVPLAEIGVVFLMFMIGLELSVQRLVAMRRWVFGAGAVQVLASSVLLGLSAWAFGNTPETAVVLGLVLSFSSTAIVMQLLAARRELGTPVGRASFGVLLLQDLAVVPVIILVGILGQPGEASFAAAMGLAVVKAVVAVAFLYGLGRVVVRPVFRHFAANRQADTFMALTLLSTLGIAALTLSAGLSMALGALLAGLVLAETEYRHEVEVTVEPFRGLLMGLFFMSVGMGVDPLALLRDPIWLPLSVLGLMAVKSLLNAAVLRGFGLSTAEALEAGILLGQGGEFAFIVLGAAMVFGLLPPEVGQFMLLVVGFSMMATPPAARLGRAVGDALRLRRLPAADGVAAPERVAAGHVLIGGFGRVGRMLAQIFDGQRIPWVAVDADARLAARHHARGQPVYVGDASRTELLRRVDLADAIAVVLTMDHSAAALRALRAIRQDHPALPVFARARDEKHALALREAGATAVIPETLESSLQLASFVLAQVGLPDEARTLLIERERDLRIAALRGDEPADRGGSGGPPPRGG